MVVESVCPAQCSCSLKTGSVVQLRPQNRQHCAAVASKQAAATEYFLLPSSLLQTGLAGDSASGGETRADLPNLYAELYSPDAPEGQRYTTLARSRIMRMYHSTAALTTNGTILVSGCDRCSKVTSDLDFDPPAVRRSHTRMPDTVLTCSDTTFVNVNTPLSAWGVSTSVSFLS